MGLEAATKALLDAGTSLDIRLAHNTEQISGLTYDSMEAAYVGYCYGDSTSGQVSLLQPRNHELISI